MPAKILGIGYNLKIDRRNASGSGKGPAMATVTEAPAPAIETRGTREFEPEGLYEFVNGGFIEKSYLFAFEVQMVCVLMQSMVRSLEGKRLGRVFINMPFRLNTSPRLDRRPDMAFVSQERWPIDRRAPKAAAWEVVPELAVEMIRPASIAVDLGKKIEEYFRAGCKAVWVIYTEQEWIYVYSNPKSVTILGREDTLDASPVLPGFQLVLADLFGEPDSESV